MVRDHASQRVDRITTERDELMFVRRKEYQEDIDTITEILALLMHGYMKMKDRVDELEGTTSSKKAKTRGKA